MRVVMRGLMKNESNQGVGQQMQHDHQEKYDNVDPIDDVHPHEQVYATVHACGTDRKRERKTKKKNVHDHNMTVKEGERTQKSKKAKKQVSRSPYSVEHELGHISAMVKIGRWDG